MVIAILLVLSYLSGSIPSAYLITRLVKKTDIRQHGSGNVGATNVFRVAGPWAGVVTLLLDALKGYVPVLFAIKLFPGHPYVWIMAAMMAVVGHIWTIFLSFKGGKGVATGAGIFLALLPMPTLYTIVVFSVVFGFTKYISLGSITSSVFLPAAAFIMKEPKELCVFAAITGFLIIVKHHSNIKRLLNGTENKLTRKK